MWKVLISGAAALAVVIGGGFSLIFILYPLNYKGEITAAGAKYDIEPALIAAVINAESSFDKTKISKKGAVGLMQILPTTAAYMTNTNPDLFDAKTNIDVGVKYLAYLINKFGDTMTALFAYNAGEGNVAKWLAEQRAASIKATAENTQAGANGAIGETARPSAARAQLTSCPFPETNAYVNKIQNTVKYYTWRL